MIIEGDSIPVFLVLYEDRRGHLRFKAGFDINLELFSPEELLGFFRPCFHLSMVNSTETVCPSYNHSSITKLEDIGMISSQV